MKSAKFTFISLVAIAPFLLTNCKKGGCMNENAINYAEEANEDDGTCLYEASMYFWYDEATADALVAAGHDTLSYFFEDIGIQAKASTADFFSAVKPACGVGNAIGFERYLGNSPSKTVEWYVEDQNGTVVFDGTVDYSGGVCKDIELIYP